MQGTTDVTVNQQENGGEWVSLGNYHMSAANAKVTLIPQDDGSVAADAVKAVKTDPTSSIYYVHTDHLGAPRAVLDNENRLRWRWITDPFGQLPPETDPSALGVFSLNLRFPGQYYDSESGMHYNFFRDYDPVAGRYVESDPIGLAGGINTYSYALNQPTRYTDPDGRLVVALPWVVPPVVEGLVYIGSAAAAAWGLHKATQSDEQCKDKNCPPCKTVSGRVVPVDTVGYRPLDVIPDTVVAK